MRAGKDRHSGLWRLYVAVRSIPSDYVADSVRSRRSASGVEGTWNQKLLFFLSTGLVGVVALGAQPAATAVANQARRP